jgi:hypothetical protein
MREKCGHHNPHPKTFRVKLSQDAFVWRIDGVVDRPYAVAFVRAIALLGSSMPHFDNILEMDFHSELAKFVQGPFDPKELQLARAVKLIAKVQQLDEQVFHTVVRVSRFLPSAGPAFLASKIHGEVQRRQNFIFQMNTLVKSFLDRQEGHVDYVPPFKLIQ